MKKILLCAFIIASNLAISQSKTSLTVKESTVYKDEVSSNEIFSIHTTKNGLTGVIRKAKRNITFDIFDKDLNKVFSKIVKHHKKETFVGELFYEKEIKFFTVFSPKKKERILYCHIFNLDTKTYKKVQLFATTVAKRQNLFSARNKRQTSFALSPDGNYFAINTDNIKKNINSYTIRVFDANSLKLAYAKTYQTHESTYFEPNDLLIDNDKNVYAVGKSFLKGKSQKKKKKANYTFILNKINKDKAAVLTIDLKEEHIQSVVFSRTNTGLHLLGFYSERNINRIKGGFDFIIDLKNFTIASKKKHQLPPEVYQDLYGYRKAKKKSKNELSNFTVDYVIKDNENNTFLIAEEFYITQSYVSNGTMGGYWTTTYHYDDLLILKFDINGQLNWGRSIFKRSTSPSYNVFLKDNKLQILLNSGKKLTHKKDGRTKVSKGWLESTALYNIVLSKDGDIVYEKIQDNKKNTKYIPFYGTYENDRFIMPSAGRKKKRFMILK